MLIEEEDFVTSPDKRVSPVAHLLAESLAGRLSRRDIMKRAGALGLSAPLIGLMLSANQRSAAAQDATPAAAAIPPGSTIVVPPGLRTDLGGTTITAVLSDSSSGDNPWHDAQVAKFTEATGIEVNRIFGETDTNNRLEIYNQQFAAQDSSTDVYQIDVIWPGVVAEHAIDLNESLSDLAAQQFEAIVANNTVDDKLVGMPWFTDAGLLYHRTDLLEKYAVEVPTTWAELQTAAQTIQDGERAANPNFYGFVFQGRSYEGLTCNGLEWQVSNGGGTIVESDGTLSINNPQAIAIFEQAAGWVNTISPEGVTNYNEPDALNVWVGGNAAFLRNWPYAWAASQDPATSQISGKVGVGPLPMGDGEGARNAATLGGWQLMVSAYSQNQEAAIEYVKYLSSQELQKSFAIERSHLPTIAEVYDDPDVAAASEFIPRLKEVFQGGAVARPSSVTSFLYPEVSAIYYSELNQVLTGAKDATTAVADMESQIQPLLEELGI